MSPGACARAASDLTTLVTRLDRARKALVRQSRLPEDDFGGLSGDAYRRHAARSAVTVAAAGADLALLAGALAALGRELAEAEQVRDLAAGSPPERARELRLRARDIEHRAQDRWRAAVASYDGRSWPGQQPAGQQVAAGPVLGPATTASPDSSAPVVAAAPAAPVPVTVPVTEAAASTLPAEAGPRPALDSALVTSPQELESDLVVPATPTPHCGTPEAIDEHR